MSSEKGVKGEAIRKTPEEMTPMEEVIDIAKTVALAVAITMVFRIAFFQPFNIPSGSMQPNLLVGDFIVVSKGSYGYSKASLIYPFTRISAEGRLMGKDPVVGDVAVFKNARDGNKDYIKRVIGQAGDEIRMINGVLHINGKRVEREFLPDAPTDCISFSRNAKMYRETLPNGVSYMVQECLGNNNQYDNVGPYTVPDGHFFMMGDNRDNSQDSRTQTVSYVPRHALVGKARRLVFSVNGRKARFWEVWKWPSAIRYNRIFDRVE